MNIQTVNTIATRSFLERRGGAILCGFVFTAVLALLPASGQAQCSNWNAGGQFYIYQDRLEKAILVTLKQNGTYLSGTASTKIGGRSVAGMAHGTLEGDNFSIQIAWPDNLTGVYKGRILPTGKMNGGTYDRSNPKIQQAWRTEEPLKCAPAAPAKPFKITSKITLPPSPPPIRRSGKARPAKPAPPPPPMKVPGIVASQVIFEPPYPTGFVILTWDGGPDHPYAEVWVKVGEGDETFVVEQGKGERRVTVERNKTYLYILTDAGKTLSTDRVNVPPY